MRADFDVVGSYNVQRDPSIDSQSNTNLFEFTDPASKKGKSLVNTAGLLLKHDLSLLNVAWRGAFVFKNLTYCVIGQTIYTMDDSLVFNILGTLNTTSGFVAIEANIQEVIFIDGLNGWIWDTVGFVLTQITAPGFPAKPLDVAFLDSFFIVGAGETNNFSISDPNAGLVWDTLNSASITTHPGTITAIQTLHRRLFFFEQNFCEVWENAGLADFPFRRNNSLLMEYGTNAPASVITAFDRMFFISNSPNGLGHIIMVAGSQAILISSQAIDFQLQSYDTVSDATAMVFQDRGIIFFRLNLTQANVTWVYNVTQSNPEQGDKKWHKESMLNGNRHVGEVAVYFNETNYFGAYNSSKLYEVNGSFNTNAGEAILRERITKIFFDPTYNRIRIDRLRLDLIQGVATSTGNDEQPLVYLGVSKDSGRTYPVELSAKMGKIGDRTFLTRFWRLGVSKGFVFRIRFYNSIVFNLLGASIDYEVLPQ